MCQIKQGKIVEDYKNELKNSNLQLKKAVEDQTQLQVEVNKCHALLRELKTDKTKKQKHETEIRCFNLEEDRLNLIKSAIVTGSLSHKWYFIDL